MTQETHDAVDEQVSRIASMYKHDLAEAANSATKTIADAAQSAVKAIAEAASSASTLVIHNATESAKNLSIQRSTDHDAIVRISEKLDSLKEDVRDLKDGTSRRIDNLEKDKMNIKDSYAALYKKSIEDFQCEMYARLKTIEEGYAQIKMLGIVAVLFLGVLQFVIDKFVLR